MTTERPTCNKCGRPKSKNGFGGGRPRLACRRAACRLRSIPPTPEHVTAARPWCVACRRMMTAKGSRRKGDSGTRFRCPACGVTCYADRRPRRQFIPRRPDCPACGLLMTLRSRRYLGCQRCERLRRERREADALRVLAHVTSRLPGYLTPDERADAAHSVLLDLLAGDIRPRALTPAVLRRYVSQARGMTADRFRFISLSEPTPNGGEFGDLLAA